jgi:hypothetical protein
LIRTAGVTGRLRKGDKGHRSGGREIKELGVVGSVLAEEAIGAVWEEGHQARRWRGVTSAVERRAEQKHETKDESHSGVCGLKGSGGKRNRGGGGTPTEGSQLIL